MPKIKNWTRAKVRLTDAKMISNNPRTIGEKNLAALRESIARFGYVEPIVFNKRTGHIVGGHQRYAVLVSEGVEEATMVVVDMSEEDEMAANLTLNNPEIEGEWDNTAAELMGQVEGAVPELAAALRIGELKTFVESLQPKKSEDSHGDGGEEDSVDAGVTECDTKCPCCGFEWKIDTKDVAVGEALKGPQ